jgi:endo-1,4-beta-xylanase
MNRLNSIAAGITTLIVMAACNKYKAAEFAVDKPESVATQEDIDAYPALKSYINRAAHPDFKFGVALGLQEYADKTVKYRLANKNFDEIVLGYEMKHGAVVQADGSLALDKVKTLLDVADQAKMSVYGHTLVWHANQNATYLKGLLSPMIVTSPAYANDLNVTGLKDKTLSGWSIGNPGGGITVTDADGMGTGNKAIKLVSTGSSSSAEGLQLITPAITVNKAHKYEVVAYIKSDVPGEGRIAFEGLNNNTPQAATFYHWHLLEGDQVPGK